MTGSGTPELLSIIVRAAGGLGLLLLAGIILTISFCRKQNVHHTLHKFPRVSRFAHRAG
ncbi:MAG: hypothetical protein WC379_15805 [Methanoregula sp.]